MASWPQIFTHNRSCNSYYDSLQHVAKVVQALHVLEVVQAVLMVQAVQVGVLEEDL